MHNLKRRGKKSGQKAVVKLDMAKTYDRVERNFLESMLVAMGFPQQFTELLMACVQSIAECERLLHGAMIAQGAPVITHLFFADDSLLLCDASAQECRKLKEIFEVYKRLSGQKINVDKFSPRTTMAVKEACSETLASLFMVSKLGLRRFCLSKERYGGRT
ncbi:hypothetical protein ACLB2K_058527 [Fragaria x ananassa]